jgi:hypothetical protein
MELASAVDSPRSEVVFTSTSNAKPYLGPYGVGVRGCSDAVSAQWSAGPRASYTDFLNGMKRGLPR